MVFIDFIFCTVNVLKMQFPLQAFIDAFLMLVFDRPLEIQLLESHLWGNNRQHDDNNDFSLHILSAAAEDLPEAIDVGSEDIMYSSFATSFATGLHWR